MPKIVAMLDDLKADIICLQEVSCSNANCAAVSELPVVCKNETQTMILNCLRESALLAEDPKEREKEYKSLSAILKANFPIPNTINVSAMRAFYKNPREENVQAIIVKKLKIANKAKPAGHSFYVLVVIKAGVLRNNCELEYVVPELPIFEQSRMTLVIKKIIELRKTVPTDADAAVAWSSCLPDHANANTRVVDSITVITKENEKSECVALLEVLHSFIYS